MSSISQGQSWQEKAARKREECAAKIPSEWKVSKSFMSRFQAPLADNRNDLIRTRAVRESGILAERELEIT